MERHTELLQYTAVDREFFEPYGRREIDIADFVEPIRRIVPVDWQVRRSGIWMHCAPSGIDLPAQGWKIHVSSVASTARIVLSIAAATLVASGTAFKFAADARMLAAINGKRWPRAGSGKFITVYPLGIDDFKRIIDDLHVALSGYAGPYILSDRRYRDSRVLYYRYGGIAGEHRTTADGRREYVLRAPDGHFEPDERKPYFQLPDWLRDPFPQEGSDGKDESATLGAGRFRIRRALTFSSAGGVYLGDDLDEGRRVIVKEARPFIGGGDSAASMLRKEFRLLRRLAPYRVAPLPIAHFRDWEHSYLVEEYIEGDTLRSWLARRYPWLKTRTTRDDVRLYLEEVIAVFTRFAEALELVHGAGVSMGDLSFHNCIVTPEGEVRLIDLETAMEDGLDLPVDMRTPGFASPRPLRDHPDAARAEDAYAFGANLLAAVMPMNAMLPLDRDAASRFIHRMSSDLGYPRVLADIVGSLLDNDARKRATPAAAMSRLRESFDMESVTCPTVDNAPAPDHADALFVFIGAMAKTARTDRYVPAGPEVFQSHPWGTAHGAAGVLHAYLRGGRTAPEGLLAYVVEGARRTQDRGASLMHGDAGIAWVLFDAGERELAAGLLRNRSPDASICERAGFHDGLAGWGMARIKAWRETAESCFLTSAAEAGELLLKHAVASEGTLHWPRGDARPVGLAHGAAGTALFLLHLHVATGDERFLRAADAALAFDLAQRGNNPDGDSSWPKEVGGATLFPYLRQGTAGIVAVAARFHACTGDARYRHIVRGAEGDLLRRHAISPGLFDGLAGIGETLLDLVETFPDGAASYLSAARRIASGIEPFLVAHSEGLAVPGAELLRLSCDLATGNAGVGAFFDRLHRGGPASFMLDDHLSLGAWAPSVGTTG
jgi:hypothetical protein